MRSGKALAAAAFTVAFAAVFTGVFSGVAARADLSLWVQHQPAGPILDVLLRSMPMPGGAARFRRPPAETRPALTTMLNAAPKDSALYRLRAQEDEMQADFVAAESDWKAYADLATDRGAGYLELADFYARRVRAAEEIGALRVAGQALADPYMPPQLQRAWVAYTRMLPVIKDAGLPATASAAAFRSWMARYPKEQTPRREFVKFLADHKQYAEAQIQISAYERTFPEDRVFPTQARANLAAQRGSEDQALAFYDKAFQPLWPKELKDAYFNLLNKKGQSRDFLARARSARDKNPTDLNATGRLFAYFEQSHNQAAAERVLFEYRLAKEAKPENWTAEELKTLALLFDDPNEKARADYALYSLPGASPADRQTALFALINLLLNKPDGQIRFGSGDLSLYKDIATVDSSPGFLNGVLSLLLNSTSPRWQYQEANAAAGAYFHRAEGARLLDLFEKQFPASTHRSDLRSSLVDAYASYGDDDAVVAAARAYLTAFPKAPQRTHVALQLTDALARRQRPQEEFALYRQILTELSAKFSGVPFGLNADPRSSEYVQVLDKYLARLSALHQPMEALRVYRRELDRNPNDPGLYNRFAGYLEQNNLGAEVQDVYRRAIAKFPDRLPYDKLARWFLRNKQQAAVVALSREASDIFSGTDLEAYFRKVVQPANLGPALYLQLNLYAHQRFPQDLEFVRNLLNAYAPQGTGDSAASGALLHDYWFYDADLKRRYFEYLSSRGELQQQLAAVEKMQAGNPAAVQFKAEGEAWLGHFEAAAPGVRRTAEFYPGSYQKNAAASSLFRSLAQFFPADTQLAADFARKAYQANPADTKTLESIGDIYSDREDFLHASAAWNAISRLWPGKPDGYLERATVFWDYYRFSDALKVIREARLKYRDRALFAYEAGAIEEGRRDYRRAVEEYLAGWRDGNQSARTRIIRLASRPAHRDLIDRVTASADPELRIDVLKAQQRKPELEAFLAKEIAVSTQAGEITPLIAAAREQGFNAIELQAMQRGVAVTPDPVERMRLRIELAKYLEGRKDLDGAAREMSALSRDNPLILGVVRARVDFDKRNKRDADAIAALTEAAAKARPELSAQFRFEAARVATAAGSIDQARALFTALLRSDPYRASYLAGMAETYAAANDDAGLVRFAGAAIEALKKAPLPPEDWKTGIAGLRRRLVTTLAKRGDNAGAVDQYIEVVNAYPDDANIAREAALFASERGRREQLISFYSRTVASAPRDWRWPIVLARIETALEDFPAALNAYDMAMKARPDRADFVESRAGLEERLLRFEDAIRSYERLYQLTYHDSRWLDKTAEFQARLGRNADAVATLERAHIGAGGETVAGLFTIAEYLDQWRLSEDAARFAQRGYALAGNSMAETYPAQLVTYARIMAGARRDDAILALDTKRSDALRAAGLRIAELYTPEQKSALAARPNLSEALAQSSGFVEKMAQFLSGPGTQPAWIQLQSRRGLYERIAAVAPPPQAAVAAASTGDWATEMRLYASWPGVLNGANLDRYLTLLLEHNPQALVAMRSNQAVQIALREGNANVASDALRARAPAQRPVWLDAYSALHAVYFDDRSPAGRSSFLAALKPQTIGQRLASKADPNRALVGSLWFYYGARFGEYLGHMGAAEASDYLPSDLESQPGNPDAYIELGRMELQLGLRPAAIGEFRKALDLDPNRGEAHDGIARTLMQQGKRPEAIAEWREAMAAFQREQSRGVRVRETFWAKVGAAIGAIADAAVFPDLRADIHQLLADYAHRNGEYRLNELIRPALQASFQAHVDFDWLLDVASSVEYFYQETGEQEWFAEFRLALAIRRGDREISTDTERCVLINLLLSHGKVSQALEEWRKFTPEEIGRRSRQLAATAIRVAGFEGTVDSLLARFKTGAVEPPDTQLLLAASTTLRNDGHVPAALAILEYAYTRELDGRHLEMANFLGLARVYLERGNQFGQALSTLRRMALLAGEPFEAFEPAGDLLTEFGRDAEAREFFAKAVQATPWNAQARVKLGDRPGLLQVVADATAAYSIRAGAAQKLAPGQVPVGGELALLASADASPPSVRKPFFVESRLAAAAKASDPALKLSLLREALAIAPDDRRIRQLAVAAAIDAHRDRLALALHRASRLGVMVPDQPPYDENQPEGEQVLERNDAAMWKALAGAAERTGDLTAAERFLLQAGGPDTEPRLLAIRAERTRREQNLSRQPVITDNLEQPHIVRRRLLP